MLRVRSDRIGLYGIALAAIGAATAICQWIAMRGTADWGVFQAAAKIVGSPALLAPGQVNPFVYMPAFAWVYLPFARLPEMVGAVFNAGIMVVLCAIASFVAARIYRVPRSLALVLVFAWSPVWSVIVVGQNAAIGLVLTLLAIFTVIERSPWLEGLAVGGLLYKPQYALPFLFAEVLQSRWRPLAVVFGGAIVWYLLSVPATGWTWSWPSRWLSVVHAYAPSDAAHNAPFAVGLPTVLSRFGLPENLAIVLGLVLLAAGIWYLLKRPRLEAWSMIPLVGLATSPHAWEYDAILALPALFWAVTHVPEPARTRIIVAAYLLAPLWLLSPMLGFDTLAIIVIGGTLFYLAPRKI